MTFRAAVSGAALGELGGHRYTSLQGQAGKLKEEFGEIATFAHCMSLIVLFIEVNLRKRLRDYSLRAK